MAKSFLGMRVGYIEVPTKGMFPIERLLYKIFFVAIAVDDAHGDDQVLKYGPSQSILYS